MQRVLVVGVQIKPTSVLVDGKHAPNATITLDMTISLLEISGLHVQLGNNFTLEWDNPTRVRAASSS